MQQTPNDRKAGSSDRNESGVARMDHDAQKQRDKKKHEGIEKKDEQARKQMGVEHPGRLLPD